MLEKIQSILEEAFDVDPADVTMDASFRDDLGIDSLDLFDMMMDLEAEYGFEVPGDRLAEFDTVGDVVNYLEEIGLSF